MFPNIVWKLDCFVKYKSGNKGVKIIEGPIKVIFQDTS